MSYLTFDLETTVRSLLKRKASPFYNSNRIVAIGYKRKGDPSNTGRYFPVGVDQESTHYIGGAQDGWFADMLADPEVKMLVGFNIKFDILHAICQGPLNRNAWIEYIDRGGMVWDTQLAEYLLHGQAQFVQIASMDEVAPRYGGNLKNDAVKALWNAGVDTPDIDKDLLMEYLVGTGEGDIGDIGNTERIMLGQIEAFRARKTMRSALLNMGALCFTIEAEYNGMYVDKEWALAHAQVLEAELKVINAELVSFLPSDLPFEFKWTSRFHKSALIFGGKVKYVDKAPILDEKGGLTYYQKDAVAYQLNNGEVTLDPPTAENALNYAVFAGGKNKGEYKTKKVKVPDIERGPKMRNEDFYYEFPGFTEGSPEWESRDAEGKGTGVYSTAADVIEALGVRDIPFLKTLAKQAEVHKDLSTYFITTDEDGTQKGMLTLVGEDGIIHHQLHMNRTITGRLSSSDPNLQNVSKGEFDDETGKMSGSQIKRAFVSRFRQFGGKIIQSDFTSLEIYVQGILTMCRQLLEDLRLGLDMHVLRAEQAWGKAEGMDYDAILKAAKDDKHPEHKKWKKKRGNAKVFSFQRAYGAGVAKIAATTGMSEEEVEALILAESERYPELQAYIDKVTNTIAANRKPTSLFVNHPTIRGLSCQIGKSHFFTPDGKMYSYTEHPAPEWVVRQQKKTATFSPTEIKNYVVQGTGGEWAKAAMYLSLRAFYRKRNFGGLALLVNQVHDAVYADARDDVATVAAALLHACMLEASTYMDWWFSWPLPISVPTETKIGANMMEEHDPDPKFKELYPDLRKWVRAEFIGNHTPHYEKETSNGY